MPHATAEDPKSPVVLEMSGNSSSRTYLGLLECNGQSTFLSSVTLDKAAPLNISPREIRPSIR
jgi:hypothetical protein